MNHEQAMAAVRDGTEVAAMTGPGELYGTGKVVAYCDAPQVLVLTETGDKFWWRADMTVEVE